MSYHPQRSLSPGGKRIANQGRMSDNVLNDPAYSQRQQSYPSPRSSGGVIPISTQTFINVPSPTSARIPDRFDAYPDRTRRSSLVDTTRAAGASGSQTTTRSRPVVQNGGGRPSSPPRSARDKEGYYISPASPQDTKPAPQRKLYSVADGPAKLVAHVPVGSTGDRQHRRRDDLDGAGDRGGYREPDTPRERGRKEYSGSGSGREKSIEDEDAYSYTDAAGMYRDTEPRWREVRPRRQSLDRGTRERPISLIDPDLEGRRGSREAGPPPSTRGFGRINDAVGRTRRTRDGGEVSPSPNRGRGSLDYGDPRDPYYVPPRTTSQERWIPTLPPDRYDTQPRGEYRDPSARRERRNSTTRVGGRLEREDRSVERRGFGIRNDYTANARGAYGRTSDESLDVYRPRDAGYEPYSRHASIPSDERQWEREPRHRDDDHHHHHHGRDRDREGDWDYERPPHREQDPPRDRDRDRPRQSEYSDDQGQDRQHLSRRDDEYGRERAYSRKDHLPHRDIVESPTQISPAEPIAAGLAGAAAAFGATGLASKGGSDRADRNEREARPERNDHEWDRDMRPGKAASDEPHHPREHERDQPRAQNAEHGLGFAFEAPPEPPKTAPPTKEPAADRGIHETPSAHEAEPVHDPRSAETGGAGVDADEDYRRRMEQVQRELGLKPDEVRYSQDDAADRERRRLEREQRQRDRLHRGGGSAGANLSPIDTAPHDVPHSVGSRYSFEDEQSSTLVDSNGDAVSSLYSDPRQHRPTALDDPVPDGAAHIIDNSQSDRRENRVRIVDPPTEEEERKPKGILKKPTQKFPEERNSIREGVAPLKDPTKKGIPSGARWTKIDRRLVNPEALEAAQERFEERLDHVIVLRVLTKEEIQKLADRTKEIRHERHEEDRAAQRRAARHSERDRDRRDRDEYSDDSENEFAPRKPKMLEAGPVPATATAGNGGGGSDGGSGGEYSRSERRRDRDRG